MKVYFTKYLILVLTVLFISSCQTDYQGDEKLNQTGRISFSITNDTMDILTRKKTRIYWNANDEDSYLQDYYWAVSADMSVNEDNVLQKNLNWTKTANQYDDVAFPYNGDSVKFFIDSTVVPAKVIKYVYSRMYLYAKDDNGNATKVISRGFWRTNQKPDIVTLKCRAFLWDAFITPEGDVVASKVNWYQYVERPFVFLKGNKNIRFSWSAIDKDGNDVELKYKYEIWKLDVTPTVPLSDSAAILDLPSTKVHDTEWSTGNKELQADSLINSKGVGYYKLIVRVKDDAEEESEKVQYGVFESIVPVMDKGILLIDKTAKQSLPADEDEKGYPNQDSVRAFYKRAFAYAGYTENNPNPLKRIDYFQDGDSSDLKPLLKEVLGYRMIVVVGDSRLFDVTHLSEGTTIKPDFGLILKDFMGYGGKVMLIGSNLLYQGFSDNYLLPAIKPITSSLIKSYFGISTVTHSEGYEKNRTNINSGNYDFIGVKVFSHVAVTDSLYPMRVDSVRVNDYWKKKNTSNSTYYPIKGNGIFLPNNISTIKAVDGEAIMGYESIYNDPILSQNADLVTAGGFPTGSPTIPVLNRNEFDGMLPNAYSAVATRYIGQLDKFRSAYIGVPLSFMDNKNQVVYKNIKSMMKWFDVNQVPSSMRTTKK